MRRGVLEAGQIGEALRQLRAEQKVSQSELARRTGIAQPAISRIEAGHEIPSFDRLARLAAGLGMHPVLGFVSADQLDSDVPTGPDDPDFAAESFTLDSPRAQTPEPKAAWGELRERLNQAGRSARPPKTP